MTDAIVAPKAPDYPTGIVTEPFALDDMTFTPARDFTQERATRGEHYVGDVLCDINRFWFARKHDDRGELSDWKHMRCAAEARAFLVSKIRQ